LPPSGGQGIHRNDLGAGFKLLFKNLEENETIYLQGYKKW